MQSVDKSAYRHLCRKAYKSKSLNSGFAGLEEATGFDWDENNIFKNWDKHSVSYWECEEIFFNKPLIIKSDEGHSEKEVRYYALGKTDSRRELFVAFTLRDTLIRPVSYRDMSRKEKRIYGQYKKE